MDWGNVTVEDLVDALQEVDWTVPPRPLNEFFSRFSLPRSFNKWNSRAKCNLYYYRTNYFILITVVLGVEFLTNPLALVAALFAAFSIAITFNEKITRTVRKFSPHLATKLRPPMAPVIRGRPVRRNRPIYICGQPRWLFVLLFSAGSTILLLVSCGIITILLALLIGLLSTLLHASLCSPNLKARLNTFREEFRAVWRNYSDF